VVLILEEALNFLFVTELKLYWDLPVSRDSLVGIATGYGLDDQRGASSSPGRVKSFHFFISSRPALGSTQPPIKSVPPAGKAAGA
jgi:hypothetical protein